MRLWVHFEHSACIASMSESQDRSDTAGCPSALPFGFTDLLVKADPGMCHPPTLRVQLANCMGWGAAG